MAHDDWASQHNITIVCRAIPHIMRSFPAITCQTQDTFLHSHLARILTHLHVSCASSRFIAHLRVLVHLHIPLRIFTFSCTFAFHHASSRSRASLHFIVHLRVPSQFSAHHCRSIHPLPSQFLGALHSIYYYIWLHLVLYDYYFVMDPYITSLTYLERSQFASKPWEGAYVQLRVAMSVFTTELLAVTIYHQLVPCSACICCCSP
jgi:hypothetical protein